MKRAAWQITEPGWAIAIAIMVLVAIGIASIYVTDTHYQRGHDGPRNAAKQAVFLVTSMVVAVGVLQAGYQRISRHAYIIFFAAVLLLVPPFLAKTLHTTLGGLVTPRNGAYRWIQLPAFQLQPSEFMKVAYLIALAWYLRYRKNYRNFGGLMLPFVISAVPFGLILLEPDLGTVLLLLPVQFAMLFMAGARIKHLAIMIALGLVAAPVAWGQIKGYQRARVTAVLMQSEALRQAVIENPEAFSALATKRQALEWSVSSGYQLLQAKNAIGSGRLVGHGWGRGVYVNTPLLPDRHNDFVFAIVAHQWGFFGCLVVLGCYTVIVVAGVRIASVTSDPFARLLAVGVITLLASQVVINVGMSVGLMPITGMTLPFVSAGGSSMISNMMAIALLVSISQHRPFLLATKSFEYTTKPHGRRPLFDRQDVSS